MNADTENSAYWRWKEEWKIPNCWGLHSEWTM